MTHTVRPAPSSLMDEARYTAVFASLSQDHNLPNWSAERFQNFFETTTATIEKLYAGHPQLFAGNDCLQWLLVAYQNGSRLDTASHSADQYLAELHRWLHTEPAAEALLHTDLLLYQRIAQTGYARYQQYQQSPGQFLSQSTYWLTAVLVLAKNWTSSNVTYTY